MVLVHHIRVPKSGLPPLLVVEFDPDDLLAPGANGSSCVRDDIHATVSLAKTSQSSALGQIGKKNEEGCKRLNFNETLQTAHFVTTKTRKGAFPTEEADPCQAEAAWNG